MKSHENLSSQTASQPAQPPCPTNQPNQPTQTAKSRIFAHGGTRVHRHPQSVERLRHQQPVKIHPTNLPIRRHCATVLLSFRSLGCWARSSGQCSCVCVCCHLIWPGGTRVALKHYFAGYCYYTTILTPDRRERGDWGRSSLHPFQWRIPQTIAKRKNVQPSINLKKTCAFQQKHSKTYENVRSQLQTKAQPKRCQGTPWGSLGGSGRLPDAQYTCELPIQRQGGLCVITNLNLNQDIPIFPFGTFCFALCCVKNL